MTHIDTVDIYEREHNRFNELMSRANESSLIDVGAIEAVHSGAIDGSEHLRQLRVHENVFIDVLEGNGNNTAIVEAAVRDFDLLFAGVHKAREIVSASADDWDMIDGLLRGFANKTYVGSPRATAYHYSWSNKDRTKTYTGHPSELTVIESFDNSFQRVGEAVRPLLCVRLALQADASDPQIEQLMEQSLHSLTVASDNIKTVSRGGIDVSFVSHNLFPLFQAVTVHGNRFEGPNPSHTEFAVLDALILGNLLKAQERSPTIQNLAYRLSDAPPFMRRLLYSDAITTDTLTFISKASGNSTIQDLSRLITRQVLHFKGPHKRLANASLKARGKELSEQDPDLLSELIKRTSDAFLE